MKTPFVQTQRLLTLSTVLTLLSMPVSAFAWGTTKTIETPSAKISAAEQAELSMPSKDKLTSAIDSVKKTVKDAAEQVTKASEKAQTADDKAADAVKKNADATPTPASPALTYCPDASQLHKEDMLWYAKNGGWRSFDASFVDKIQNFAGAQWIGVEIGKIICMYKGKDASSFPVTIERDNLVDDIKPGIGTWGNDLGGYKHCNSNNPKDCGFVMHEGVKTEKDVYKVLRGLKKAIDQ